MFRVKIYNKFFLLETMQRYNKNQDSLHLTSENQEDCKNNRTGTNYS
jgi:hypothetical protein